MNVYPFIEAEQARSRVGEGGNVARTCELLEVSRSAFYAHQAVKAAGGSATARTDAELLAEIRRIHAASKGRYGAPRVHAELVALGRRHGRKRAAGKRHNAALICLARRRVDVLFAMLRDRAPYRAQPPATPPAATAAA